MVALDQRPDLYVLQRRGDDGGVIYNLGLMTVAWVDKKGAVWLGIVFSAMVICCPKNRTRLFLTKHTRARTTPFSLATYAEVNNAWRRRDGG